MATFHSAHAVIARCALLLALSISMVATIPTEAAQRPAPKMFKVGSRSLEGRPKTVCVIEGKWADGGFFRFEAWDTCSKMRVRAVTQNDYKDAPSLGTEDHYKVGDIPRGSEVLEVSNGVSTTLIFRDRNGDQHEILTRD